MLRDLDNTEGLRLHPNRNPKPRSGACSAGTLRSSCKLDTFSAFITSPVMGLGPGGLRGLGFKV